MLSYSNINKELVKAVRENNLKEVNALLSAGADPNFSNCAHRLPEEFGNKLIHYANNEEIARELLLNGAWVNSTNDYRESPLHSAIMYGRTAKLVRELLKHGASVDAMDRKGNTPLNLAVKKSNKNLEVIKELLEYGADINLKIRERRLFDNHCSPLDNARVYRECAELLIKITLIKHFDKNYRSVINLERYKGESCYNELSSILDDCVSELTKMKTDIVDENLSLYELITAKEDSKEVKYKNDVDIIIHIYSCYPRYCDVLSSKININLERASLLNKLSEIKVYTKSNANHTEDVEEKTIVLDSYSKHEVAQYLSDNDLLHFLAAFYKNTDGPLCLKRKFAESTSNKTLCEASTSNSAKSARLE